MTELAAHSPIGASSCERWWNCPGSVQLSATLPPSPTTKYAAEGTVAHSVGEKQLNALVNSDETFDILNEIGMTYIEDDFEIEVTEEMVEAVEVYTQTVDGYLEQYRGNYAYNVKPEIRFHLKHIDEQAFGTCDAMLHFPMNALVIIDYKHGAGYAVEVEQNKQLLYYALGAYYALTPTERADIRSVELVIVQPRARHLDGTVRKWTGSVGVLLEFEKELIQAIARVRAANPTLQAGSWCKWCPARAVCPEVLRELEESTKLAFTKIDTQVIPLPDPKSLTPEQLGFMVKNAENLKEFIAACISLGTVHAVHGSDVAGYKLVTKYGNRRWKSEADVIKQYGLDFGERIYNKKLKSPSQMEKVVGKTGLDQLADFWEKPVTGQTLVPADDPRDGVATGLQAAFTNLSLGGI